jgi:hypothetical protein
MILQGNASWMVQKESPRADNHPWGSCRRHHENPRWDPHNVNRNLAHLFAGYQGLSAMSFNIYWKWLLFLDKISWQELCTRGFRNVIIDFNLGSGFLHAVYRIPLSNIHTESVIFKHESVKYPLDRE